MRYLLLLSILFMLLVSSSYGEQVSTEEDQTTLQYLIDIRDSPTVGRQTTNPNGTYLTDSELIELGNLRITYLSENSEAILDADAVLLSDSSSRPAFFLKWRANKNLQNLDDALSALEAGCQGYEGSDPFCMYESMLLLTRNPPLNGGEPDYNPAKLKADQLISVTSPNAHYEYFVARARIWEKVSPQNLAFAIADYATATAHTHCPLIVFMEKADLEAQSGIHSQAITTIQAAIGRLGTSEEKEAFPPEWRITLAEYMYLNNPSGSDWKDEYEHCISTIDKRLAVVGDEPYLYALRAKAALGLGHSLRARADAISAWNLYRPGDSVGPTQTAIDTILE